MEIFGLEHIIYFVVAVVLMIALTIIFKVFVKKEKMYIVMKIIAGFGLVLMVIYRIIVSKSRNGTFLDFLPDTYCSMMGFIMPIIYYALNQTQKFFSTQCLQV